MAKKTVASLQKNERNFAKVIRFVKSEKNGSYSFKEEMVMKEKLQDALKK